MPIFEYTCQDCGTAFEKLVRASSPEVACPTCGQVHVKQELSTFAAPATFAARATGDAPAPVSMPSCGGGMCQTPGMCGRNN